MANTPSKIPSSTPAEVSAPDEELLHRVVQGTQAGIERLAESAGPQLHQLQQGLSSAGLRLREQTAQARRVGAEWTDGLRCTVRDRPLSAVAAALAIGLLIGRLAR